MSYSARIMNLPASPLVEGWASDERHNYKIGHSDARHAAAEIAAEADARLEVAQRMAEALNVLCSAHFSVLEEIGAHGDNAIAQAQSALAAWKEANK